MAARFEVDRAGRYRVRAEERPGSYPVERVGVGRQPPFGHPLRYGIGALAAFMVAGGGFALATGMGIGASVWGASHTRATLAR